jgi:hypothetical protein
MTLADQPASSSLASLPGVGSKSMMLPMTLPATPASCLTNWKHSKMTLLTLLTLICLQFLVRQRGYVRNAADPPMARRPNTRSAATWCGYTPMRALLP